MSIERDLFSAILAMDAYNRGYGAGINSLSEGKSTALGNATVLSSSAALVDSNGNRLDIPASFYALAYDVGNVAGFAAGGPMFLAIFEACIGRPFDLPRAAGGGPQACARVPRNRSGNSGQIRRAPAPSPAA